MIMENQEQDTLIEVRNLKKYFQVPKGFLHAVDDVSLTIAKGKTVGLVGESGCGKSTFGRVLIGLLEASDGEILFKGENVLKYSEKERSNFRKQAQIVFQDPFSSLNPRMSVSKLISEPLVINNACSSKQELTGRIKELMDTVGLSQRLITSYPHELDGGRRQRIGIARALALNPEFIVLDEPVSALDVSIQAQILNLLDDLQKEQGYTYLFISHDLSVVRYVSDYVAVMYLGKVVEMTNNIDLFSKPLHPYTLALLSAVPVAKLGAKKERVLLEGDIPSPVNPKPGCRFAGRCAYRQALCSEQNPELKEAQPGHFVACHFTEKLQRRSS